LSYADPGGYTNETICGGTELTLTGQGGGWQSETTWNAGGGGWYTNIAIPSYQQGLNMSTNHGSTQYRNSPDVAIVADNFLSINGGSNNISTGTGTSGASPLWAGFLALVNEQRADNGLASVVNLNDALYTIGQGPNYAGAFHDITTGNNTNSASPNNFFAVAGYDLCTGWGSPTPEPI
jgi:subtilase family serine protease